MIPLDGPMDEEAEFQKENVEIILDITDCSHIPEYGHKYCLEFRGVESSNNPGFYKAFNDITEILEEISTTLNNDDE
jgi:hypothetical protein